MAKKIIKYTMVSFMLIGLFGSLCQGIKLLGGADPSSEAPFPYTGSTNTSTSESELGDLTSVKENDKTLIVRLLGIFGLNNSIEKEKDLKFIDYAKAIINMALSLVAFFALIISIYTFYLMFFTDNEAGIKKAKGNLTGILIALCVIGLARLIVSVIFWRYEKYRQSKEEVIPSMNVSMMENGIIHNQIYPII